MVRLETSDIPQIRNAAQLIVGSRGKRHFPVNICVSSRRDGVRNYQLDVRGRLLGGTGCHWTPCR